MWRLSVITTKAPRSGIVRAGMRRNRASTAATGTGTGMATSTSDRPLRGASATNTTTNTTHSEYKLQSYLRRFPQHKTKPYRHDNDSRWFHTSPLIGAKQRYAIDIDMDMDMDIDPNDPDDIPDFLDDDFDHYKSKSYGDNDDDDNDEEEREQYRLRQEKVNDELDNRTGRPWRDPWEIKDELWMQADSSSDSLPDWSPAFVSRVSLERLQILPSEDGKGVPTLEEIVEFSLPRSDPVLHPARKTKTYAAYRKSQHYGAVKDCVAALARDRIAKIISDASSSSSSSSDDAGAGAGADWDDRQETIDALFESLQEEAKADPSMDILSKHPAFPSWVDRGLEEVLRASQREALNNETPSDGGGDGDGAEATGKDGSTKASGSGEEEGASATSTEDGDDDKTSSLLRAETPVFMDCYDPSEASADGKKTGPMVPKILTPLSPHRHGGPGRMVEEWELSAHSTTKRIMLRECTQKIARVLTADNNNAAAAAAPKVYVHGRQGVGKTAVLASIVAAARKTGTIVFYLPDGDRLRKNGFFITPSSHPDRKGMFDLQDLSQEALKQLVESHDAAEQMEGMAADKTTLELYFKDTQFKRLEKFCEGLEGGGNGDGSISLLDLIAYAQEHKKHAPMCYSVVLNRLMHQTEKKFMIVMDEFNCLFDKGHYFHMAYDKDVREPIPYDRINLFEPIMAAMDLTTKTVEEEEEEEETSNSSSSSGGTGITNHFETSHTAVVVGTSESHAIRQGITSLLTDCAERRDTVTTVEVPRFSSLEADHILANFEATGVGKLRLDRGDTVMNLQEMEYLKMTSGSIGQKLLDVSIF